MPKLSDNQVVVVLFVLMIEAMTRPQVRVVATMVTLLVAGFVFMGYRSNRRRQQMERLRKLEEIKVEKASKRTRSVVFAKENILARTEIRKDWMEVKEVEERDLPRQEYCFALDECLSAFTIETIYKGEPIIKNRIVHDSEKNLPKYLDKFIGTDSFDKAKKARRRAVALKVFPFDIKGARLLNWKSYEVFSLFAGKRTPLVDAVSVRWAGKEDKGTEKEYVTFDASLADCEKLLLANDIGGLAFKRVMKQ